LGMIVAADTRALVVLLHTYRAARHLLSITDAWWSGRRAAVMEELIMRELAARGFDQCMRSEMVVPCEDTVESLFPA
jgi:hypothetical protein